MERWYVVHTQALSEAKALYHLKRQGFEVYLPRYRKRRRHARRTDWVQAPLFPRYLFLRMDPDRTRWLAVRSTVGVSHLICNGDRPAPLPDGIIEDIRARENDTGEIEVHRIVPFRKGQTVQITAGAMCDRVGLFDCESDEERVTVLLDLLGREVRVCVPVEAIAACN